MDLLVSVCRYTVHNTSLYCKSDLVVHAFSLRGVLQLTLGILEVSFMRFHINYHNTNFI